MVNPKIFITVDVEEIFDWGVFDRSKVEVPRTLNLQPFQSICNEYGAKPIYFLTYPILSEKGLVAELREIYERGECELGIHIHTWTTPPNLSSYDLFSSYQGNLPYSLEKQKIEAAFEKFKSVLGFAPTCHRSGRFGCGPNTYQILKDIGITDDFSPSAEFDFSHKSGPDFSEISSGVFIDEQSGVRCYPVTGQRFISGPDWINAILHRSKVFNRMPDFFARRVVRLTPEGNSCGRLVSMCNGLLADGLSDFVFTIHATSFLSGGNPYTPMSPRVGSILQTTSDFLHYFFITKGGENATLSFPLTGKSRGFTEYLGQAHRHRAERIRKLKASSKISEVAKRAIKPVENDFNSLGHHLEPSVSAIIPTFNRKDKTRRAIESVLSQTYPNIEIVVVDDGSTDDTGEMVSREFPEVKYHIQDNAGVSAARNKGVSLAAGDYIAFLDSDDQWHPGKIAAQMEVFARYPDLKICWTDASAVGPSGRVEESRFLRRYHEKAYSYQPDTDLFYHVEEVSWKDPSLSNEVSCTEGSELTALLKIGDFASRMYLGNFMLTPTIIMPRDAFRDAGGFSTTVRVGEDYDFNARVCRLGDVGLLDYPLCATQLGGDDHLRSFSLDMARANLFTMKTLKALSGDVLSLPQSLIDQRERHAYAWLGTWELEAGDRSKARSYLYSGLKVPGRPRRRMLALLLLSLLPKAADLKIRRLWQTIRGLVSNA